MGTNQRNESKNSLMPIRKKRENFILMEWRNLWTAGLNLFKLGIITYKISFFMMTLWLFSKLYNEIAFSCCRVHHAESKNAPIILVIFVLLSLCLLISIYHLENRWAKCYEIKFDVWRWRQRAPLKCCCLSVRLHGIATQKTAIWNLVTFLTLIIGVRCLLICYVFLWNGVHNATRNSFLKYS
jgi:hypothetical protein